MSWMSSVVGHQRHDRCQWDVVEVGVLPAHGTFLDFGRESERLVNLVLQVLRKIAARALVVHHAGVFQLVAEGFEFCFNSTAVKMLEGFFGLSHAHEGGQVLVFVFDGIKPNSIPYPSHSHPYRCSCQRQVRRHHRSLRPRCHTLRAFISVMYEINSAERH